MYNNPCLEVQTIGSLAIVWEETVLMRIMWVVYPSFSFGSGRERGGGRGLREF